MKKGKKTILLTGGHAGATGYATIQSLRKNGKFDLDIYWVGAKSALEGRKTPTFEESFLPKVGVKFIPITAGRIQRRFSRYTIPSLLKIPLGFVGSFWVINKIKPDIVISFGGFTAFPVVVVASFLGIPVIIHEQTAAYGRANRLSQKFAVAITLARRESLKFFDNKKSVVIGNPVAKEIWSIKLKTEPDNPPVIFVTGGSRGSEIINNAVQKILPELTSKCKIIHQVGLSNLNKYKSGRNYEVYGVIPPGEWYKLIEKSDIIISRAGANIVSEIVASKRPSLLIPIPWSFADEQNKNAIFAKEFGIANIMPQSELSEKSLLEAVEKLFKNWKGIIQRVKNKKSPDSGASQKLADLAVGILS